jgi:hypothetical protein
MAKGFYLSLRMPVKTAALFADVFFDLSPHGYGEIGRCKNTFDHFGRPTSFLIAVEKSPRGAST